MILDRLPDASLPWPIVLDGVYLLAKREKCATEAYLDWPGRIPTLGFGEVEGIKLGMTWTVEECDHRLCDELIKYAEAVRAMCSMPPTKNQLAALVVCAWNIGLAGMRGSSMMKLHNAGKANEAARAFALWNKARDATTKQLIEVDELTSRRAAEAALYLTPDPGAPQYPVSQAVAPEPPLVASPTVQSSTVATVTGAVTLGASVLSPLQGVATTAKSIAADLGFTPVELLGVVILVIGVITLYRRLRQRSGGVA